MLEESIKELEQEEEERKREENSTCNESIDVRIRPAALLRPGAGGVRTIRIQFLVFLLRSNGINVLKCIGL